MANTNFLQIDNPKHNIMDDATYQANTQRQNGVQVNDLIPSIWFNKALYQSSTFVAALCQMLAANGISTSDADINALAATLAVLLPKTNLANVLQTVPWSPTPTFDASQAWQFFMLLTGNVTSSSLINVSQGQKITFCWAQDTVGNHTVVYPPNVHGWAAPFLQASYTTTQVFEVYPNGSLYPVSPPASGV